VSRVTTRRWMAAARRRTLLEHRSGPPRVTNAVGAATRCTGGPVLVRYILRHYGTEAGVAYVRKKKVKGQVYHQIVANHRVDGRPRQRVLLHLGNYPTVDDALEGWPKDIERLRALAREVRGKTREGSISESANRKALERAASAERRAAVLEAKLKKAHKMTESGVV
jgi:hypothetical protein